MLNPSEVYTATNWYRTAKSVKLWHIDGRFFPILLLGLIGFALWKIIIIVSIFIFLTILSIYSWELDYLWSLRFRMGLWFNESRFEHLNKKKKKWIYRNHTSIMFIIRNKIGF